MRTWLDFESGKWVSEKPMKFWTGLVCVKTGEKIYTGDLISVRAWNYHPKTNERHNTRAKWIIYSPTWWQEYYRPILISH